MEESGNFSAMAAYHGSDAPSTSLDLRTASFENQFDHGSHFNNVYHGGNSMQSNSMYQSENHNPVTPLLVVNTPHPVVEGGDERNCIEDFAKELALERRGVEEVNREIKEEAGANCYRERSEELMETEDYPPEESKEALRAQKDPELFVTFEKQLTSNVDSNMSRQNPDFNDSLGIGGPGDDLVDIKTEIAVEKTGGKKSEKENGSVTKPKRKRKPRKISVPDLVEIQMVKHPLLPPCYCLKRKCQDVITFDMRSHVHDKFWVMNMHERQEWLKEHLLYVKPKSRTTNPISTLHESHRRFFLPNQSEKIEVCRKMFFATLGFKDEAKFLQSPKMLNSQGMLSVFRKRKCIVSRKHFTAVQEYCKEVAEANGCSINLEPGSTNEIIIPSGYGLRDMFNEFCVKRSIYTIGYHKFRQIIEVLLRGDRVENYEHVEFREHDEDEDEGEEKVKVVKEKKKKSKPSKSKDATPKADGSSPVKKKKRPRKKAKTQQHLPKEKKKTILKSPLFSNLKHTINKKKRIDMFPNSATNTRYNFRESINVLTSYSEDQMMESAIEESIIETFKDFIRDDAAPENSNENEDVDTAEVEDLEVKPDVEEISVRKKTKKLASRYLEAINKIQKPRKKKIKSALRRAQLAYHESRRKTGLNHPVLTPCNCTHRKCSQKITESRRQVLHDEFWAIQTKQEKKKWIEKYIVHCKPRSRSTLIKFPRKHMNKKYYYPNDEGTLVNVCRVFFMRTLGYYSNMVIDSLEVGEHGLDIITITDDEEEEEEDGTKKTSGDGSRSPKIRTELSSETGNMEERVVIKQEIDEEGGNNMETLEGLDKKNVFFTPEMEREEVEKVVSPSFKRRRPLSLRNSKEHHPIGEACQCGKKCSINIPQDRREAIHSYYWSLITYNQRKQWILDNITRELPKRRTVLGRLVRKRETRKCYLTNWEGNKVEVCRNFFLSTLGFKWDKMIDTICKTTPLGSKFVRADLRGKRAPVHKIPDDITNCIKDYLKAILKTFPYVPPAPRNSVKLGLKKPAKKKKNPTAQPQNGVTIKTLYADYKAKHPFQKVSYATFRKVHMQVREIVRTQNPDNVGPEEENDSAHIGFEDNMPASPSSDHGFAYVPNNPLFDSRRQNNNTNNNNSAVLGGIPPLQSCMYNDQPQLLNLSSHHHPPQHPPNIPSNKQNSTNHNQTSRLGGPSHATGSTSNSGGSSKFSKAHHHQHQQQPQQPPQQTHHPPQQDFAHLLPFSSSSKGPGGMYQLPGHSASNLMPPYSAAQTNPLDPFCMSPSTSQGISNPLPYPNLHFTADLIGHHPHLPPPSHHHHPHLYQHHLPYPNRFPTNVLPQALKDHNDHSNPHNFYNPQMDFNQDHHADNMFQFKDTLNYSSFTPDNLSNTHSPVHNQIPNPIPFPGNSGNVMEHSNSSNQALPVGNFAEDMSMGSSAAITASSSNVKPPHKNQSDFIGQGTSQNFNQMNRVPYMDNVQGEKKKRSRSRKKKEENPPKPPRVKKVRPVSLRNSKEHHPMLPPCSCGKKCREKINQRKRELVYHEFWALGSYSNRKQFIASHMKREDPRRRTNLNARVLRKTETRRFFLNDSTGLEVEVCRQFFLHTLGLKWDKIIGTICKTTARDSNVTPPDMRGRKTPAHKMSNEVIQSVGSYARAILQAAKPEYLANLRQPKKKGFSIDTFIPYGLNMKNLHQDYKAKHASHKISYESFRKIFRQIRKEVLEPGSVTEEERADIDKITDRSDIAEGEPVPGTINATTGRIDTHAHIPAE